jgi:hypothetical protein
MARKKKRRRRPWWRKPRVLRRSAIAVMLLVLVGIAAWFAIRDAAEQSPPVYLVEPAAPFSLPAVGGGEATLDEHFGRHNVLLYFNEGTG